MPLPLTVAGSKSSAADLWYRFLTERDALTARMKLSVCDGCDGCGLRCMSGFTVTETEYDEVQSYLAQQPAEETMRVARQEKTVPWPGEDVGGATVTFCRYRDMEIGNCSIYPVRATVCRIFGHTEWLPCPIEAVTEFPSGGAEIWNRYQRFEKHTWQEWDLLKEPKTVI